MADISSKRSYRDVVCSQLLSSQLSQDFPGKAPNPNELWSEEPMSNLSDYEKKAEKMLDIIYEEEDEDKDKESLTVKKEEKGSIMTGKYNKETNVELKNFFKLINTELVEDGQRMMELRLGWQKFNIDLETIINRLNKLNFSHRS